MKYNAFKYSLLALAAAAVLACAAPAHGQNTLRKLPTVAKKRADGKGKTAGPDAQPLLPPADTVVADVGRTVAVSGYEKPLRASKETVLVTNLDSLRTLDELTLQIEYLTPDGRMLHKRTVTVYPLVAPGETRLVTFPTWDVNRLFYYHLNVPRTNSQATPYTVTLTPATALLRRPH